METPFDDTLVKNQIFFQHKNYAEYEYQKKFDKCLLRTNAITVLDTSRSTIYYRMFGAKAFSILMFPYRKMIPGLKLSMCENPQFVSILMPLNEPSMFGSHIYT